MVYTQLLNKRGTVESDVTIVPLGVQPGDAHRSFYVVTGTSNCTRDADHIATAARRYSITDIILGHFSRISQLNEYHPRTRRVLCSTSCPCWLDADWCLKSECSD